MRLLRLFLVFLKVGAVSFGGGYGMISLLKEEVLSHGWLSEEEFISFIAVSESTPGPIAINMATFIGGSQAGVLGSFLATLGVVLPSFFIILTIASLLKNLLKYAGVNAFLTGVRPVVSGLILATALTMMLSTIFAVKNLESGFHFEWRSAVIFLLIASLAIIWKKVRKQAFSPILLILLSAGLGMLFFGVLG